MPVLARFIGVGAVNTAIGLAAVIACLQLGFGDYAANAIGYGVGFACATMR